MGIEGVVAVVGIDNRCENRDNDETDSIEYLELCDFNTTIIRL